MSINKYQHRYTEPPPCILSRRVGSRSCDFTARWKLHAVLGRPVVTGPHVLTKSGVYADTHVPFTHRPSTCVQMHTHDPLQRHTDGPTLSERPPVHTSPRLPLHSPLALPSPTPPRPRDRPSFHTHFQLCPRHGPLATGPASASFPLEEVEGHRSSRPRSCQFTNCRAGGWSRRLWTGGVGAPPSGSGWTLTSARAGAIAEATPFPPARPPDFRRPEEIPVR